MLCGGFAEQHPHFGVPEEEHEVRQAVVLCADGRREGDGVLCYARERDECAAQRVGPEREQPTPYAEQGGELWNPRLHGHFPGRGAGVDVGGVGDALRGRPGAGGDDAGADAGEDSEQPVGRVPDLEHGDGEADEGGEVERRVHGLAAEDWSWIRETDLEQVGVDPFLERGLRQQLLVGHGGVWHPVPDHMYPSNANGMSGNGVSDVLNACGKSALVSSPGRRVTRKCRRMCCILYMSKYSDWNVS